VPHIEVIAMLPPPHARLPQSLFDPATRASRPGLHAAAADTAGPQESNDTIPRIVRIQRTASGGRGLRLSRELTVDTLYPSRENGSAAVTGASAKIRPIAAAT